MEKGIAANLTGANVAETAKVLTVRLLEMGRNVEHVDAKVAARLGSIKAAGYACDLLVRNGVIVIITHPKVKPDSSALDVDVNANDTPDFAAEKILDELAAAGVLAMDEAAYSPEDEEQIRKRLADLGYIE